MKKLLFISLAVLLVVAGGVGAIVVSKLPPKPGTVIDEAMQAGLTAADLPGSDNDYLHDMDYGLTNDPSKVSAALQKYLPTYNGISPNDDPDGYAEAVTKAVVRGRNNWTIWTAGNDTIWDELSRLSFGNLDFLKTLSSRDDLPAKRANRWEYLGLVNEPCFKEATGPREDRYGLWLDTRVEESAECPADPFEDESAYPGVKVGARGENGLPVGSYYGYASGVVGLRLFPNPDFDAKAQEEWDPDRYYTDASYFNNKDLVKPYRVGMSCAFCHVGPNPTNPPTNFDEPKWENLNSNPGAQYFWIDRIFDFDAKEPGPDGKFDTQNFIYQLFHTSRPGALDTSLVSSDQINNPRTMNAVYDLGARVELATKWGKEELDGGELNNKQLQDYSEPDGPLPADGPLNGFYDPPTVLTPRVLKDGADSVGALGALNRVYVNIGLFSEEWLLHFIPLLGGPKITPFPIATAEKNSVYWNANLTQTPDTALFFLASAKPDKLEDAPDGAKYLTKDKATLTRGKEVFAETCARCHSSKLPEKAFTEFFPNKGCVNSNYLDCWNDYWQWTKTDEFKDDMKKIALNEDFLDDNFLSTELRIPATLLETNLGSPLATNAIAGDIWNDFSSTSYKELPAVGTVTVHDPFTYEPREYEMPGGGRGYTRPPSLTSMWSTAPYLLNNTLGYFDEKGTVEGRMKSFDDSIHQLLWPEDRDCDSATSYYYYANPEDKPDCPAVFVTNSGKKVPGIIDRTSDMSYLSISGGFLPDVLRPRVVGFLQRLWPGIFGDGGIRIGPIPEGTPINLISNIDLSKKKDLIKLAPRLIRDLKSLPANATNEDARAVFGDLVEPLLNISKSPDFVVNRGHYFGTDFLPEYEGETPLSDDDKNALIAFLKTL